MRNKVMGILIYLNRIKNNLPPSTRTLVIQSLALSVVNYCSKIWGAAGKTQLLQVQRVQNFAARIAIGNIRKRDHITPYINRLQWLKIDNKCTFDVFVYVYKLLNDYFPSWLLTLPLVSEFSARRTRQQNNLFIPQTKSKIGERNMAVRGPSLWNDLPETIKNSSNVIIFKKNLKKHFMHNQMYN